MTGCSVMRDPNFWRLVISHPMVAPHVLLSREIDIGSIVSSDRVFPFASEHGGYLLFALDQIGRTFELHSMFTPEGWGREAARTAKEGLQFIFGIAGADLITTLEVEGHWRSAPPRSFGWIACGEFKETPIIGVKTRLWSLSSAQWFASPVHRREISRCH